MKKHCIIIAGPTAVGKTAIAIQLAQHFSTKIISADSRQCYNELNIGVAKPSAEELAAVPHYFINTHSIQDNFSAAGYERYALDAVQEIFAENDIAVMVGGTGLYIKAFCEGLDAIPAVQLEIRNAIIQDYERHGIAFLKDAIRTADPLFFEKGEMQNPQRIIRALEVYRSTGKSITSFQSKQKKPRDFNIIKIGLELPRDLLYKRINERVDQMMVDGLETEVRNLVSFKTFNALQTVGYREMFGYVDGDIGLPGAVDLIKRNTRHYAKRQMTWFKKEDAINWCQPKIETVMKIAAATLK